jgi:hypothetical protein
MSGLPIFSKVVLLLMIFTSVGIWRMDEDGNIELQTQFCITLADGRCESVRPLSQITIIPAKNITQKDGNSFISINV